MDSLHALTSFQWFVIFGLSFLFGCLGFYFGEDLGHKLKLFLIGFFGCLLVSVFGRFFF